MQTMNFMQNRQSPKYFHGLSAKKDARFEAKMSVTQKEYLSRAAMLEGLDLSSFVISAAIQKARRVIQETSLTLLDEQEYQEFLDFIKLKQKPTAALKELMAMDSLVER